MASAKAYSASDCHHQLSLSIVFLSSSMEGRGCSEMGNEDWRMRKLLNILIIDASRGFCHVMW